MFVPVSAGVVARAVIVAPIVLITVAVMPAILFLPLLPTGPSRRVLAVVTQLRTWHAEVIHTITTGSVTGPVGSSRIKR
ncbi:hypothetical protein ILP97_18265 [Amycolatopsis sp. H6(2020)]|nr:hypothetical protein [Amycolatopsis sp. H6(2020)]